MFFSFSKITLLATRRSYFAYFSDTFNLPSFESAPLDMHQIFIIRFFYPNYLYTIYTVGLYLSLNKLVWLTSKDCQQVAHSSPLIGKFQFYVRWIGNIGKTF